MNRNWTKIFEIVNKPGRLIIGLMSGTSLDGLDIALCRIIGSGLSTTLQLERFTTIAYADELKAEIKQVFSKRAVDLQMVALMNEKIAITHAGMILDTLKLWGIEAGEVDVIASHGQTIFHAPASLHGLEEYPDATLQIGDGDHIAVRTGIITISDFRQKHVAAGGEGAPLAVYGDYLLFSEPGEVRFMLNIGGIANFTFLPGDAGKPMFSTDVGPGNTLMDQFMQQHYGVAFDRDAAVASRGKVSESLLGELMLTPFLAAGFPKTTGPELFNLDLLREAMEGSATLQLSNEDVMATLSAFTARAIAAAVERCLLESDLAGGEPRPAIYLSGGGMHNPLLVRRLHALLPGCDFFTTKDLGFDPDAKEAALFALLANETLVGQGQDFSAAIGIPAVSMGKISFPY
ncbi:anhydro-N-acetylmuramic acid kinase [Pedobacter faecalis]|uniref:anhydro-N-acetylmuramic acid kinase n=1 Tax=Pedobacter faecalis TaxID=3041495 RepID=UPI00254E44E3|nr:anhydro-N-acetylmuramic acid kinase [Pedobacter sp. ELA7]